MTMQTLLSFAKIITLGVLLCFGYQAVAQKTVNGNGNIQEKKCIVKKFTTLNVQLLTLVNIKNYHFLE